VLLTHIPPRHPRMRQKSRIYRHDNVCLGADNLIFVNHQVLHLPGMAAVPYLAFSSPVAPARAHLGLPIASYDSRLI
jgi:hypothetical protein